MKKYLFSALVLLMCAAGCFASPKDYVDGTSVTVGGATVSAVFSDCFYVRSDEGWGIKVTGAAAAFGSEVDVYGTVMTDSNGERYIAASDCYASGTVIAELTSTGWVFVSPSTDGAKIKTATLTINSSGTYIVYGSRTDDSQLKVAKGTTGVTLIMKGLTISNSTTSPVLMNKGTEVNLVLAEGTTNTVSATGTYNTDDNGCAAIYMKSGDDESGTDTDVKGNLTISGSGTLNVSNTAALDAEGDSAAACIQSKGNLTIESGTITATSAAAGIKAKNNLNITGGEVSVTSYGDGLKGTDDTSGAVYITGGAVTVDAYGSDGISAASAVYIKDASVSVTVFKTASSVVDDSMKAIKVSGDSVGVLTIAGNAVVNLDTSATGTMKTERNTTTTADDTIHSDGSVVIDGGTININSGDDALHANETLTINGGTVTVTKCYEGLEAHLIQINGGYINLAANDDGINAASSNYSSSNLYITGGTVFINCSGDGLDANGSIYISGGYAEVYGSTNGGNAALDYDGTMVITGGTIFAVGNTGMAQTPSTSSTQLTVHIKFSATQNGNTDITIKDSSGTTILSTNVPGSYNSLVYSSPDLTRGSSYTFTAGSLSTTQTLNSTITTVTLGGQGGGGGGGGGPQPPSRPW
ncbi:MAG: carbohydrate-binding domain-containing protein [Abditibacteriota bacterium]|nr:carbohydrate-binding domain-containing protein [Abditibacteriota bacterium]